MSDQTTAAAAGTITIGDLTVNRMGFGAMRVTGEGIWGDPPDREEAKRVLRRAVELGVDFIDTADSYGPGVSENLIAEVLYPYPEGLVIATKGGMIRPGPGQWTRKCHPDHLEAAVEGSLMRLRMEQIPLYQLHAVDLNVPLEESIGALVEMQQAGKIRHIGVCNVDETHLEKLAYLAPVVSVQNRYNVLDRDSDAVLDHCAAEGLAFLPWAPVARGVADDPVVTAIAGRLGVTAAQVLLAWLLQRSPVIVPIPGTGSLEHLEENTAAAGVRLSEEDVRQLDSLRG